MRVTYKNNAWVYFENNNNGDQKLGRVDVGSGWWVKRDKNDRSDAEADQACSSGIGVISPDNDVGEIDEGQI